MARASVTSSPQRTAASIARSRPFSSAPRSTPMLARRKARGPSPAGGRSPVHARRLGPAADRGTVPPPRRAATVSRPRSPSRARSIISCTAASPKSAFISFWLRNAVAAATPTSAPVSPPVWRKTLSMIVTAPALTPSETPRVSLRLVAPMAATSAEMVRTHSSRLLRVRGPRSGEADQRPASVATSRDAERVGRPVRRRPVRSVGRVRDHERGDVVAWRPSGRPARVPPESHGCRP